MWMTLKSLEFSKAINTLREWETQPKIIPLWFKYFSPTYINISVASNEVSTFFVLLYTHFVQELVYTLPHTTMLCVF